MMEVIADYSGNLLNHVETLYRPGERELAIMLVKALGCSLSDTGFKGDGEETFLAAHPNPADPDIRNNAFFISPMRPEQQALEARLLRFAEEDAAFKNTLETYRETARTKPFGVPHFAIRYASARAVEDAAQAIRALPPAFDGRLNLRIFRPGDPDGAGNSLVQGFLYQDVIVSGSFLYGQLIELQSQPQTV